MRSRVSDSHACALRGLLRLNLNKVTNRDGTRRIRLPVGCHVASGVG